MRNTPFAKKYPNDRRQLWDRFDHLPLEYRQMVASDPDGNTLAALEAAESLAREAGLLPSEPETEKKADKKELRRQKDRQRTEEAKKRSYIVYRVPVSKDSGSIAPPPPPKKATVTVVEEPKEPEPKPKSKFEHNEA